MADLGPLPHRVDGLCPSRRCDRLGRRGLERRDGCGLEVASSTDRDHGRRRLRPPTGGPPPTARAPTAGGSPFSGAALAARRARARRGPDPPGHPRAAAHTEVGPRVPPRSSRSGRPCCCAPSRAPAPTSACASRRRSCRASPGRRQTPVPRDWRRCRARSRQFEDPRPGRPGTDRGLRHARCRPSGPTARASLAPGLVADQWGRDPGGRGRGHGQHGLRTGGVGVLVRRRRRHRRPPDPDRPGQPRRDRRHRRRDHPGAGGPDRRPGRPRPRRQGPGPAGRPARRAGPGCHGHRRPGAGPHRPRGRLRRRRAAGRPGHRRHRLGAAGRRARHAGSTCPGIINGDGARVLSIAAPGDGRRDRQHPGHRGGRHLRAGRALPRRGDRRLGRDHRHGAGPRQEPGHPGAHLRRADRGRHAPVLRRRNGQDETAFTAGAQPFAGPAAVSGLPVRAATDVRVSITAPDTAAEVDIVLLPFRGGKEAADAHGPATRHRSAPARSATSG